MAGLTFTAKVLLVCFTLNEGHAIDKAWFESHELPWHLGFPMNDDSIKRAVEKLPRADGVQFAVFKWGVLER